MEVLVIMSAEVGKYRVVVFFFVLDLIDITSLEGWGIFDVFHVFIFFDQSCFPVRGGKLTFLRGCQNSHPMPALLLCHRLNIDRSMINIDRCMIKASDHDMLDHALVELFILLLN